MTDTKRSNSGKGWAVLIFVVLVLVALYGLVDYHEKYDIRALAKAEAVETATQAQAATEAADATASQVAAQRNYAAVEDKIAHHYLGEHNMALAATHFRNAATAGDVNAYSALALYYHFGFGVPQDYAEAYFWDEMTVAHSEVSTDPKTDFDMQQEDASHLTKSVLLATQERARKWLEAHPSN
jgi:hypothetical protein